MALPHALMKSCLFLFLMALRTSHGCRAFPSKPCALAPLLEDNGGAVHQAIPTCLLGDMLDAANEVLVPVSGPCSAMEPLRLQCQVPNIVVFFEHCVPALQALVLCLLCQPLVVGDQVHCSFPDEFLVLWHMEQASVTPSNVV